MKRLVKILGTVIFRLIIIIAIGGYLFVRNFDLNQYKSYVEDIVDKQLGRKLAIKGNASVGISLIPTLVVEDVELANAPWAAQPQMVKVQRLEIKLSLLPLLRGEHPAGWRRSLYYHFYEYPAEHMVKRHYGARNDRWKLIHFYNDIDQWELYDLQEDPHELRNLYGLPEYAAPRREMTDELVRLQTQYGDTLALRRNGRVTAANGN